MAAKQEQKGPGEPELPGPASRGATMYSDERLVDLVRSKENLFDRARPDYKDEEARNASWGDIASVFNVRMEDCQTRWVRLRERFGRELRLRKRGTPPGKQWPLYGRMRWLERFIQPRNRMGKVHAHALALLQSSSLVEPQLGASPRCSGISTGPQEGGGGDPEPEPLSLWPHAPSLWAAAAEPEDMTVAGRSPDSDLHEPSGIPIPTPERPLPLLDAMTRALESLERMVSQSQDAEELFARSLAASLRALPCAARARAKVRMLAVLAEADETCSIATTAPSRPSA